MVRDYNDNEPEIQSVSEPAAEYGVAARKAYRVISDEEIARCIPLEESRRRGKLNLFQSRMRCRRKLPLGLLQETGRF